MVIGSFQIFFYQVHSLKISVVRRKFLFKGTTVCDNLGSGQVSSQFFSNLVINFSTMTISHVWSVITINILMFLLQLQTCICWYFSFNAVIEHCRTYSSWKWNVTLSAAFLSSSVFIVNTSCPNTWNWKTAHFDWMVCCVLSVMLQPFEYDPSEKNKHKFMVQSMYAPEGRIESQDQLVSLFTSSFFVGIASVQLQSGG